MNFLSRIFSRRPKTNLGAKNIVTFDATGVFRTMSDGQVETVTWNDMQEIAIVTTDEGPLADDVFWILSGPKNGCAIPSETEGMKELLPRLQALAGFKNEAVIQAMGSTGNAKFICWQRPNAL